jgi:hypothetical protein
VIAEYLSAGAGITTIDNIEFRYRPGLAGGVTFDEATDLILAEGWATLSDRVDVIAGVEYTQVALDWDHDRMRDVAWTAGHPLAGAAQHHMDLTAH